MRWAIYVVKKRGAVREIEPLGYVNAPHQPAALLKAFEKWEGRAIGGLANGGFSAREYSKDHASLGKLWKGAKC